MQVASEYIDIHRHINGVFSRPTSRCPRHGQFLRPGDGRMTAKLALVLLRPSKRWAELEGIVHVLLLAFLSAVGSVFSGCPKCKTQERRDAASYYANSK